MRKVGIGLVAVAGLCVYVAMAVESDSRPSERSPHGGSPPPARFTIARDSAIWEDYAAQALLRATATAPGRKVASTTWDLQSYDAVPHQIATNGSGQYIHFVWTHWDVVPKPLQRIDRFVNFNTLDPGTGSFLYGVYGVTIYVGGGDPSEPHQGFVTIDVDESSRSHVAFQMRDAPDQPFGDYSSWELHQSAPNFPMFTVNKMFGSAGVNPNPDDDAMWPHVTADQIPGGADVIHVVSHTFHSNDNLLYWRFKSTDNPQWQGPIVLDSTIPLSYNVAADRTSDKAALITTDEWTTAGNPHGLRQVTYRESPDNGSSWIDGTGLGDANEVFITSYNDPNGPEAWFECVDDYDNSGTLHVVWDERRYASADTVVVGVSHGERTVSSVTNTQAAWKHWDKTSGITSTIHVAYYENAGVIGGGRINVAYPSLGFGDGTTTCNGQSNLDYVDMTFVQFGGPATAQQNDLSARGFMNGDVYLSASGDGGLLWSPAVNLTNSLSPGCDPATGDSCQSENWPSVARTVDDTIHLMYIADRDAGAAPLGEGAWTFNPVMYYRIPGGTDAPIVCPALAPNLAVALSNRRLDSAYTTGCGYSITETLTVANLGPGALAGNVGVVYTNPPSGTWLTVAGAGPFGVAPGGAVQFPVTMNATGLGVGLYQAEIRIANNDTTKPNPLILPVAFEITPGCVHQGDLDDNGVLDVFDVVALIDHVFQGGGEPTIDPGCPTDRGDTNCDRVDDIFDIVALIDYVFSDGEPPCGGCGA